MRRITYIFLLISFFMIQTMWACKYTIREIGYSTLSKVTYVIYRIDENKSFFSKQWQDQLSESNVTGRGVNLKNDPTHPAVQFSLKNQLSYPAYVLAAPDGRMISIADDKVINGVLTSPVRQQLLDELPRGYAKVI